MPVPSPNLNPVFNIVRLSHVELGVSNLAASRAFYVDTLGLQVTFESSEEIFLRAMEERGHHCIVLKKTKNPKVNAITFKVFSETDLDKAEKWFREQLSPTEWVERPYQGRTLRSCDIHGVPIEFYHKMDRLDSY
jgi:catechol 2,3-dioxygenase